MSTQSKAKTKAFVSNDINIKSQGTKMQVTPNNKEVQTSRKYTQHKK